MSTEVMYNVGTVGINSLKDIVMTRIIVMMIGVLCWFGAVGEAAEEKGNREKKVEGMRVRVMSFNIRYGTARDGKNVWENRKDLVADVFVKYKCDFVGVQEALGFQIKWLKTQLPSYKVVGRSREVDPKKGEAVPIFYRGDVWKLDESGTFWFSDTPEKAASNGWGNRIPRITTWARFVHKKSKRGIYVFNTHYDHRSQSSREKSSELLLKRIGERKHTEDGVIVTGDFNAGESNVAIKRIKKGEGGKEWVDTFRVKHPDAKNVGTFCAFKGVKSGAKIDYVFVAKGTRVHEAKIVDDHEKGRYPSDHFPVFADVEFRRLMRL